MPTFEIILILLASAILGALGRRFSGGLLSSWIGKNIGAVPARILQALLMTGIAALSGVLWMYLPLVTIAVFIGTTVGFWGSMGATGFRDYCLLFLHGVLAVAPLAALAWYGGFLWYPILISGALRPLFYKLAWLCPLEIPFLRCQAKTELHPADPPPTAELLSGAAFGVALAIAILLRSI